MDAKIIVGLVAGAALLGTYYVEGVVDSRDRANVKAMQGPEALAWLRKSENESALASNRFPTTRDAIRFVQQLYNAGATRVIVPNETISKDDVEVYGEALVVTMPSDPRQRERVWTLCAKEIKRGGENPAESAGESHVFLWWD